MTIKTQNSVLLTVDVILRHLIQITCLQMGGGGACNTCSNQNLHFVYFVSTAFPQQKI
jgi:hypothetical protein